MSVQNRKTTEAAPSESRGVGMGVEAAQMFLYPCTNHLEILKKARILPHRWARGIKLKKACGNGRLYVFSKYEYLVKILQCGY